MLSSYRCSFSSTFQFVSAHHQIYSIQFYFQFSYSMYYPTHKIIVLLPQSASLFPHLSEFGPPFLLSLSARCFYSLITRHPAVLLSPASCTLQRLDWLYSASPGTQSLALNYGHTNGLSIQKKIQMDRCRKALAFLEGQYRRLVMKFQKDGLLLFGYIFASFQPKTWQDTQQMDHHHS